MILAYSNIPTKPPRPRIRNSLAATGNCRCCLLYAANRALKTSVVNRSRVQPHWFDTRHSLFCCRECSGLSLCPPSLFPPMQTVLRLLICFQIHRFLFHRPTPVPVFSFVIVYQVSLQDSSHSTTSMEKSEDIYIL